MDVIYLKNGSSHVLFGDKTESFARLLNKQLGPDAERQFRDFLIEQEEKQDEQAYKTARIHDMIESLNGNLLEINSILAQCPDDFPTELFDEAEEANATLLDIMCELNI